MCQANIVRLLSLCVDVIPRVCVRDTSQAVISPRRPIINRFPQTVDGSASNPKHVYVLTITFARGVVPSMLTITMSACVCRPLRATSRGNIWIVLLSPARSIQSITLSPPPPPDCTRVWCLISSRCMSAAVEIAEYMKCIHRHLFVCLLFMAMAYSILIAQGLFIDITRWNMRTITATTTTTSVMLFSMWSMG